MRAAVIRQPGDFDAIEIIDVITPEPGPGQVRIKVAAAAVNPVDVWTRIGLPGHPLAGTREQWGLGWDVSGTVDAIGPGVDEFTVGEVVIAINDRMDVPIATQADFVVLPADSVVAAPTKVGVVEASTIALNGLTALQALDLLTLDAGETLLVTGAAGGLGGYATQLAAGRGVRVIATSAAADEEAVRALGASEFVARGTDLAAQIRELVPGGVDAVIDAALIGAEALAAARDGARFVAVTDPSEPTAERDITVQTVHVQSDRAQLTALVEAVDRGALTLRVAEVYPLADLATAHKRLAEGGVRGRLVVTP